MFIPRKLQYKYSYYGSVVSVIRNEFHRRAKVVGDTRGDYQYPANATVCIVVRSEL